MEWLLQQSLQNKAFLHHISTYKEKDRSGVSKRIIYFTVWFSNLHAWRRSEIKYQGYDMAYVQHTVR